ncbi:hypothetical protein L4D77_18345 [Photobacterium frigidiphilum]|uniref:hypothetical protein n=1 Tax=Photobacterium frigidiphilum TaxID=264736 RepID=UPI003D0D77B4
MEVLVMAREGCFHRKVWQPEGSQFVWQVPVDYILKAKAEKKQVVDVMPEYLSVIGKLPELDFGGAPGDSQSNNGGERSDGPGSEFNGPENTIIGLKHQNDIPVVTNPTDQIRVALASLDPNDDDHWTGGGLPSTSAVSKLTGFKVSRTDINEIAPNIQRNI